ncbi:hypothetical protein LJK88_08615 [Paenibacillus sp. P26]|nr:hypothetical protein LJK88_08615 [Paenibacillus sp. P26]
MFGADLKGYTARAGFLRGGVPGTDSWSVSFEPGTDSSQTGSTGAASGKSYSVYMNSVNGTVINAGSFDDTLKPSQFHANPNDTAWRGKGGAGLGRPAAEECYDQQQ